MTIDGAFAPKLAKKARLRFDRHENMHMILYPERGLALSETAAAIALRCDGTRSVLAIVNELAAAAFPPVDEAMKAQIERDVVLFLEDLKARGLLETP